MATSVAGQIGASPFRTGLCLVTLALQFAGHFFFLVWHATALFASSLVRLHIFRGPLCIGDTRLSFQSGIHDFERTPALFARAFGWRYGGSLVQPEWRSGLSQLIIF
jgi:hypothetical protein